MADGITSAVMSKVQTARDDRLTGPLKSTSQNTPIRTFYPPQKPYRAFSLLASIPEGALDWAADPKGSAISALLAAWCEVPHSAIGFTSGVRVGWCEAPPSAIACTSAVTAAWPSAHAAASD